MLFLLVILIVNNVAPFNWLDYSSTFCWRRHWTESRTIQGTHLIFSLIQYSSWILSWQFINNIVNDLLFSIAINSWNFKARQNILLRCRRLPRVPYGPRPCNSWLPFLRTDLLRLLPLTTSCTFRYSQISIFPRVRLIILFIVQVRIENTIFRIAVCKRSKVVQDALIKVAGCRRENIIDWRSHWVLAYIRTFNQKLLLTTLGVQNFLSAVLFHRSCTFSWTWMLNFSFEYLWRIYCIYVKSRFIHIRRDYFKLC